jgi:hypothetical protein
VLRNQAGEARLVMNPGCKDFEKVHWKADPHGDAVADIDRSDPRRSHLSDALGYMIEKESQCRRARDGNQGLYSSALQIAMIVEWVSGQSRNVRFPAKYLTRPILRNRVRTVLPFPSSECAPASQPGAVKAAFQGAEGSLDGWPRCNTMRSEGNGKCDAIRE